MCLTSWAQKNNSIQSITVADGLSNNWVNCFAQDALGFVWVGTQYGLNRYDGKEFINYTSSAKESGHLIPENNIYSIALDNEHRLLVVTESYLTAIDIFTTEVIFQTKIGNNKVENVGGKLLKAKNGNLYLLNHTTNDLLSWNGKGNINFQQVLHINLNFYNWHIKLIENNDGHLWCYNNVDAFEIIPPNANNKIWSIGQTYLKDVYSDNSDKHTNFVLRQIFHINPDEFFIQKGKKLTHLSLKKEKNKTSIFNFYKDNFGRLWLICNSGVYGIDLKSKEVSFISSQNTNLQALNECYAVTALSPNVILIGTFSGIVIINNLFNNFERIFYTPDALEKEVFSMRGIAEDENGNIYATGNSQLLYYTQNDKKEYNLTPIQEMKFQYIKGIDQLFTDSKSNLLVAQHGGLMAFNPDNTNTGNQLQNYFLLNSRCFSAPKEDKIWYAHDGILNANLYIEKAKASNIASKTIKVEAFGNELAGIKQFDLNNHKSRRHPISDYLAGLESSKKIYKYLFWGSDGSLWIAAQGILLKLYNPQNFDTQHFTVYSNTQNDINYKIPDVDIYSICEDSNHHIWLATKGAGVIELDENGKIVQTINKKNGLPNELVASVLAADDGSIWIATFDGLSRYNPKIQKINNFYTADGLTHNEFNFLSSYKSPRSSRFYLGGLNGINAFNPLDFTYLDTLKNQTPLAFTSLKWFSESKDTIVKVTDLGKNNQTITLNANDRMLNIRFALLNFSNSKSNVYSYRILEFGEDWVDIFKQNELQFPYLNAGNYTIEIRSRTENSNWSDSLLTLNIRVKQVFYKTWWFVLACALGLGAIFYALFRYRLRQIRERHAIRTAIATNLHDELGTLMTGITMNVDMTRYAPTEKLPQLIQNIDDGCKKLIELIRDTIWTIDARNDNANDLLHQIEIQTAQLFNPLDIAFQIKNKCENLQATLQPEVRQAFYFIFKEAINNIAKHSQSDMVNIVFEHDKNQMLLNIVCDENKNRSNTTPKLQGASGKGLKNMQLRAKNINAILEINKEDNYSIMLKKVF